MNNVLRALGVPVNKAEDYLINSINEHIDICSDLCSPCASYTVFSEVEFQPDPGIMLLSGVPFHLNKMVLAALDKSTEIAVFMGTCGEKVEQFSKKLMKQGNSLEGYIVDIIGSEIAEGVADFIHKKIELDAAQRDIKTTNRYSPGYCNWPVSDQHQLFSLMQSDQCGIKLTKSSLMIPIKSVSGIAGLGKHVQNKGYACAYCDADYCTRNPSRI